MQAYGADMEAARREARADIEWPELDGHHGIAVLNVPLGSPEYVQAYMRGKAEELREEVDASLSKFLSAKPSRRYTHALHHHAWALLKHCMQYKAGYWLRNCLPSEVEAFAEAVDATILAAVERVLGVSFDPSTYGTDTNPVVTDFLAELLHDPNPMAAEVATLSEDAVAKARSMLHLPTRLKGAGIRRMATVRDAAFIGCMNAILPRFLTRNSGTNTPTPGFFDPQLGSVLGRGSFNANSSARQYDHFLNDAHGSDSYAAEMREAERILFNQLDAASGMWTVAIPTARTATTPHELREVAAGYFFLPSPCLAPVVGCQIILPSTEHNPVIVDLYGDALMNLPAPGDAHWRVQHDAIADAFRDHCVHDLGIAVRREVDDLFQQAVPLGNTVPRDELKDLVPDAELSLPAFNVVTGSYDPRSLKSTLLEFKTMRFGVKYTSVPRATAVDRFERSLLGDIQWGLAARDAAWHNTEPGQKGPLRDIMDMSEYTGMVFGTVCELASGGGAAKMATDLDKTGLFSVTPSTNVGDPYDKRAELARSAYKGKQFLANGQKWGKQTPDCYIDKDFKRLTEGEPYKSTYDIEREHDRASRAARVSEKPFRPSHPAKTSKNSAGLDGCIGEVYLSRPDGEGSKTDPKIHPRLGPKNFTISAPKTAPAGYPLDMVMIGKVPEYMVEPYHPAIAIEKKLKKVAREKIHKPWGAVGGKSDGVFDRNIYAAPAGPLYRDAPKKKSMHPRPFAPSSPARKGNYAYAKLSDTNYINWNGEPYKDPPRGDLPGKAPQLGDKPFRPIGGAKTVYTPSINPYSHDAMPPLPEIVQ
eukprot:jgi/Tetstr1/437914/TSEL_026544.t1